MSIHDVAGPPQFLFWNTFILATRPFLCARQYRKFQQTTSNHIFRNNRLEFKSEIINDFKSEILMSTLPVARRLSYSVENSVAPVARGLVFVCCVDLISALIDVTIWAAKVSPKNLS